MTMLPRKFILIASLLAVSAIAIVGIVGCAASGTSTTQPSLTAVDPATVQAQIQQEQTAYQFASIIEPVVESFLPPKDQVILHNAFTAWGDALATAQANSGNASVLSSDLQQVATAVSNYKQASTNTVPSATVQKAKAKVATVVASQ